MVSQSNDETMICSVAMPIASICGRTSRAAEARLALLPMSSSGFSSCSVTNIFLNMPPYSLTSRSALGKNNSLTLTSPANTTIILSLGNFDTASASIVVFNTSYSSLTVGKKIR